MDIRKRFWLVFVIPLLFLIVGIATLKDYGVNWDEPFHFMRGQAYLHFLLTGEKDYHSLPPYPRLTRDCFAAGKPQCESPGGPSDREDFWGGNLIYEEAIKGRYPESSNVWRSYFQHDTYTFNQIVKTENGHPAVGDILAAFFNFVFYQKLHILGDIESYHFFEVVASFLLVLGVALVTYYEFGVFPALVASFSLAAYPLFFSESHFNIKDPPEAAFFGLTIISFYLGVIRNKWPLIILASIFAALALGTKFNGFFIFPILATWFIFYFFLGREAPLKKYFAISLSLILFPLITGLVFYFLWPYLWADPIGNFLKIVTYYRQIGLGTPPELTNYLINGWNTYPSVWIFYTTPIPVLVLSLLGLATSVFLIFFRKKHFALLVVLWFLLPILRVSLPNSSIYGGVRQIMEFVPPLAILAGIGAWVLLKESRLRKISLLLITLSLIFVFYEVYKIHPNENVYFNQLAGGLSGAKAKAIPYWGNSYGNAYQQGINWLNQNAGPNAKLGLPISTMGNLPRLKLRSDIDFSNSYWSGPGKEGEYEIELSFDWAPTAWYSFAYYNTYLNPVYEAKVDGVPILKVWQNDLAHTREGFAKEIFYPPKSVRSEKGKILVDLGKDIFLTRIEVEHGVANCRPQKGGYLAISTDDINWEREPEPIDYPQVPPAAVGWDEDTFVFLFAAKKTRYLLIDTLMENSCLLKSPLIKIRGLAKLPGDEK